MRLCPQHGLEIRGEFCPVCGKRMIEPSACCGAVLLGTDRYCPKCGKAVARPQEWVAPL